MLCHVQSMANADAASSNDESADGQALARLEGLQLDVRAALEAAQDAQGNGPVLQDSLAKVTTLLETMVRVAPSCSTYPCGQREHTYKGIKRSLKAEPAGWAVSATVSCGLA